MYKWICVLGFSAILLLVTSQAGHAQSITPAGGGGAISADDFNSTTFTTLDSIMITESSAGQISLGFIEFTAPSGFRWDTGGTLPTIEVVLAPGNNGQTQLNISFSSRSSSKIIFEVTRTSDDGGRRPGRAIFRNFRVRPTTGTLPNEGNITNSGSSAPGGNTNYGSLTMVEGNATKVRVETAADGSGSVVSTQTLDAGNTLTVYPISRDQNDNFVNNPSADSWDIVSGTGGVTTADITPAGDNKSATFRSTDTGSGQIRATEGVLSRVPSGTITVKAAAPSALRIATQPSSTATAGQAFAQQPVIEIIDVFGNVDKDFSNNESITATRKAGSGTLKGTTSQTLLNGVATFSNLNHEIANDITIEFNNSQFQSVVSNTVTVSPAAASQLGFTRQPPNGARNSTLDPGPIVQVQDAFGNSTSVGSPVTVNMTVARVGGGTGDLTNNSTTSLDSTSSFTFDDLAVDETGEFQMTAATSGGSLSSVTSDEFQIAATGVLAQFRMDTLTTQTSQNSAPSSSSLPDTVAGDTLVYRLAAFDGTGSLMDGSGTPEYTEKATITSPGNNGFGLGKQTVAFSGGFAVDTLVFEKAGDFVVQAVDTNSQGQIITSQSNTFTVRPGPADTDSSLVEASLQNIVADSASTSLITVTLRDRFGNQRLTGGETVAISTDLGNMQGAVTDNNDGTYTQQLQSGVVADTATVTVTLDGQALAATAEVIFVADGLARFTVETANSGGGSIPDQTAGVPFDIRVIAQDENGNRVTGFSGTVSLSSNKTISAGGGTTGSFINGVLSPHSITLTETGADATITADNTNGTQAGTSAIFTVNPAAVDPASSTVTAASRFIQNTGSSTTTITVQANDQFGNNTSVGVDAAGVSLSTTAGTLQGSITESGTGAFSQSLQSTTNIETATLTGSINSTTLSDNAEVTFTEFNTWQSSGGGGNNPLDWDRGSNWTLGVPTSNQAVIIPANPTNAQKFPLVESNPTVSFLQVADGATVNVESGFNLTITNDLEGDGALILDNAAATIAGDINIANLNAGNSTITLNGTGSQQALATIFTDILNIENSSNDGVSVTNYVNANTRLTVTDSKLTMQSGSTFEVFNDVTGNGRIDSDNATFLIGGDVTIDTMNVDKSDVTFNGTAAQTINNITDYRNLEILNTTTGGVALADSSNISGTVTVASGATLQAQDDLVGGTLSAAGGILKLAGDFGITTVSAKPNTVEFNGTANQTLIDFDTFNNLTVNKTGGELLSTSNVLVDGTLTLSQGDLVMGTGTNLLAPNRSLSGGIIRFQLRMPSRGWYAATGPVKSDYDDFLDAIITQGFPGAFYDSSVSPNDTLQPNIFYYQEDSATDTTDNQRWRTISSAADSLVEGRGHFIYMFGNVPGDSRYTRTTPNTLDIGGNEFTGNGTEVTFDVTFTPNDVRVDTGWNLVGNPYGATIDWDDDANWTKTNVDPTIYIWDHTANSGNGAYKVWNANLNTGDLGNGLIAPFQGFWVKANAASPVLKVHKDTKTVGGVFRERQTGNGKKERSEKQQNHPVIELKLVSDGLENQTFLAFTEDGSRWRDSNDSFRLVPFSNTFLNFFSSIDDGTPLTVNNWPRKFGRPISIPIHVGGFKNGLPLEGLYTLSWPELKRIPSDWKITLYDRATEKSVNIRSENFYSFDMKASEMEGEANGGPGAPLRISNRVESKNARFELRIEPGADGAGLPQQVSLDQNYPNPFNPTTTIRFGLPVQSRVTLVIYDILGRKIATLADDRILNAGFHTLEWEPKALASGVYLYRLQTGEESFVKKMTFIK